MADPVSVLDVAAYILENSPEKRITTWKLQKLCYYAQAWSLVWDEEPLFEEEIQAWANGPVVPKLYYEHQGKFRVSEMPAGDSARLDAEQRDTVDAVLRDYGTMKGASLSALTHRERPWRRTRRRAKLDIGERGSVPIPHETMHDYYNELLYDEEEDEE